MIRLLLLILFLFTTQAILGKSVGDFYGHVDREKKSHFEMVVKNVGEGLESRFLIREKWWESCEESQDTETLVEEGPEACTDAGVCVHVYVCV